MPIYRAAAADEVRIVPLDTLTLVYHRPAGATHLLAEPAPELLAALQAGPADAGALLDRLAASYELGEASAGAVAARLHELVEAGLVTTA